MLGLSGFKNTVEELNDLLQEKEDFNRALPYVRLSSQDWPDRSVGRT
jgi:hypothetical protein